jgi:tetratricopeptide (TPR) repeat protein
MVLGLVADTKYKSITFQLAPGSRIVLYTDGITDARNEHGDFYGLERLCAFMEVEKDTLAELCIKKLIASIDEFYGDTAPNDDRTIIVANIRGKLDYYMGEEDKLKLVYTYIKIKEYKKAIDELESIISMNNQSLIAHKLLGKTYALSGDLKKAEIHLIRAIELDDRLYDIYYNLAVVKYHLKQYKEAAGCFTKVKTHLGEYKKTDEFLASIEKMLSK